MYILFTDTLDVEMNGHLLVCHLPQLFVWNGLLYPLEQRPYHGLNFLARRKRIHQKG